MARACPARAHHHDPRAPAMSDAPSKSNADIDKPRRGIGRFLWLNAIATTLGCIAIAVSFDHVYVLYPLAFGVLLGGMALIFREMFSLLGEDSQYAVDETVASTVDDSASKSSSSSVSVGSTPHAA